MDLEHARQARRTGAGAALSGARPESAGTCCGTGPTAAKAEAEACCPSSTRRRRDWLLLGSGTIVAVAYVLHLAGATLKHALEDAVTGAEAQGGVERFIDAPDEVIAAAGGDMARAALEQGLVDELLSRDELRVRLIAKVGERDGSFVGIGVGDYLRGTKDPEEVSRRAGPVRPLMDAHGLVQEGLLRGAVRPLADPLPQKPPVPVDFLRAPNTPRGVPTQVRAPRGFSRHALRKRSAPDRC